MGRVRRWIWTVPGAAVALTLMPISGAWAAIHALHQTGTLEGGSCDGFGDHSVEDWHTAYAATYRYDASSCYRLKVRVKCYGPEPYKPVFDSGTIQTAGGGNPSSIGAQVGDSLYCYSMFESHHHLCPSSSTCYGHTFSK